MMMVYDCPRVDPLDIISNAKGKVTLYFSNIQNFQATPKGNINSRQCINVVCQPNKSIGSGTR